MFAKQQVKACARILSYKFHSEHHGQIGFLSALRDPGSGGKSHCHAEKSGLLLNGGHLCRLLILLISWLEGEGRRNSKESEGGLGKGEKGSCKRGQGSESRKTKA